MARSALLQPLAELIPNFYNVRELVQPSVLPPPLPLLRGALQVQLGAQRGSERWQFWLLTKAEILLLRKLPATEVSRSQ